MTKTPFVSVIMCCYNEGKYLKDAVESILNQSFDNFEFIIIDDCSTDNTSGIIDFYKNRDKRIVSLRNAPNLGISESANKGIEISKGKYIARMDADDIAAQDRLLKQVALMEENPAVVVCGTNILLIDEDKTVIGKIEYKYSDREIKKELFMKNPFANPTVMIRKDILSRYSIWYETTYPNAEDYQLWFKLAGHGDFRNINEFLLRHRIDFSKKTLKCKAMVLDTISLRIRYLMKSKRHLFNPFVTGRLLFEILLLLLPAQWIIKLFLKMHRK